MDFKPNTLKIILSIIIAVVGNTIYWYTIPAKGGLLITGIWSVALITVVSPTGLIYLLFSIAIIYVPWSLIQKEN